MATLPRDCAADEAPTLLDTLARAPAAAALIVAALDQDEDRKALRLAHPQLRDAVGEATTKLQDLNFQFHDDACALPTPQRWPRLEELTTSPAVAARMALGAGTWGSLRLLDLYGDIVSKDAVLDEPWARALAAALRRMPALRSLVLRNARFADAAAEALLAFWASSAEAAPQLRSLKFIDAEVTPASATAIAATGWRLEELVLSSSEKLDAAGVAALVAAPTFALRRLDLSNCDLDVASLLCVANAPWPLEELRLDYNGFRGAEAAPALAALSRHARLRMLGMGSCQLNAAAFKALVEASWPALTFLDASHADVKFEGQDALGAAAFAGFPKLEVLILDSVPLGDAGARMFASGRWPRLRAIFLDNAGLGDAGLAALAGGKWPALRSLLLRQRNDFSAPPSLDTARRWAPALENIW